MAGKFKLNSILEKNKITLNDDMGDVYKNFQEVKNSE
jgi:ATP-binding cassette subfamily B protein